MVTLTVRDVVSCLDRFFLCALLREMKHFYVEGEETGPEGRVATGSF